MISSLTRSLVRCLRSKVGKLPILRSSRAVKPRSIATTPSPKIKSDTAIVFGRGAGPPPNDPKEPDDPAQPASSSVAAQEKISRETSGIKVNALEVNRNAASILAQGRKEV